ncbi:hypothetical protein Tco_1212694 [Tanacetum coccineum]
MQGLQGLPGRDMLFTTQIDNRGCTLREEATQEGEGGDREAEDSMEELERGGDVAKDSLGVASEAARTHSTQRESWWFCEEVQTKVATKQARFKELLSCRDGNQEDIDLAKERYKVAKREAKIVVARAKDRAYEDLYKKLDSKEGANDIYKIAKARERKRQDIGNVRCIKDEGGRTIVREEDIRKRWGVFLLSFQRVSSHREQTRKERGSREI